MAAKKQATKNVDPKILAVFLIGLVLAVGGWVYYQRTDENGAYAEFQEVDLSEVPEGIVDDSELPPDIENPPMINPDDPVQDPAEIPPVQE